MAPAPPGPSKYRVSAYTRTTDNATPSLPTKVSSKEVLAETPEGGSKPRFEAPLNRKDRRAAAAKARQR